MAYELFIDGFDYYATQDITKKWLSYSSFVTIESTSGRRGGGCLTHTSLASGTSTVSKAFDPSSRVVIGFAMFIGSVPPTVGSYNATITLRFGTTAQFVFSMDALYRWSANRSGVAIHATSVNSMTAGAWNYIEMGIHLADAGSYELRVNGQSAGWLPSTSYDTMVTAGAAIDNITITRTGSTGGFIRFDDFYITYGDEIKFLGDSRVDTLALTANSTPQDWTPDTGNAWERLNQDAGYISSGTVNAVSLFAAGDISHNPSLIHGIQINGHAYKSDSGYREAALVLKSGATTDVGTPLALSTDTLLIREPHIVDPNTGAAFTKANLNAIEAGAKVTA